MKEAVVLVREDRPGDQRLVAYVISDENTEEWREYLQKQLPNHMIPAHFVELEHFPLTPNGKIDRKALPIPDEQAIGDLNVLPRTPSEELIASVWGQVLGIENISIQDSFFERGGHSLLATQIVSRLQELFQLKFHYVNFSSTIQWKHWRNEWISYEKKIKNERLLLLYL
ncbi:phosphopantetheine-binding protein [Bacillus sp. A17A.1]